MNTGANRPGSADDPIARFYEEHPYPAPVANLDADREEWSSPLRRRAEYHLLYGTREYREDLDILVAGCGTFQAVRHALRWPNARVVGIDVSETSVRHTEELRERHSVGNLAVHVLPIERVSELKRDFDLVICTGVLHHLADPDIGLRSLRDVLRPGGAMLIMVYAPYGRTGVKMMQEYSRLLGVGTTDDGIRDFALTLKEIPEDHPLDPLLRRSPDFRHLDAVADALLNPRERTYSVPELLAYIDRTGLFFGRWYRQAPYSPQCGSPAITPHAERLRGLAPDEQYAAVELFRGSMVRHSAVVHRADDDEQFWRYLPGPNEVMDAVPIRLPHTLTIGERLPPGAAAVLINRSHTYPDLVLPVDATEKSVVEAIDGHRSVADLADLTLAKTGTLDTIGFIERLYRYDQIVLASPDAKQPIAAVEGYLPNV